MRFGVVVSAVNAVVRSVETVVGAGTPLVVDVDKLFTRLIALERLILPARENISVREFVAVVKVAARTDFQRYARVSRIGQHEVQPLEVAHAMNVRYRGNAEQKIGLFEVANVDKPRALELVALLEFDE